MSITIHPTAMIEDGVEIGEGTAIWDNVHVRRGARVGRDCIIGEKTYLAPDVVVSDRVKINAFVYLCTGVTLETGVMVAAGCVFTNDRFPRATTPDLSQLLPSEADEKTLSTLVKEGATIGARSVVGCDLDIGRFAMVGMGSIVSRSIPDFHLVVGSPARSVGMVCRCGQLIERFEDRFVDQESLVDCTGCGRRYRRTGVDVQELPSEPTGEKGSSQ